MVTDDFEADQEKIDQSWAEVEQASAEVDRAWSDLQQAECVGCAERSSDAPRRQYSQEEIERGKEVLGKVVEVGCKSAVTLAAVAGAGVVSLFKRDSAPIGKTFDWCKKTFWK